MLLASVAVVSFAVAKVVLRLTGHDVWADASGDLADGAGQLLGLRKRRLAKSVADALAGGIAGVSAHGLPDNDRRAATDAVARLMDRIGDDLAVQVAVTPGAVWAWVLENGGEKYRNDLGGAAGDYFERLLRHCVGEVERARPPRGFQTAAEVRLLRRVENLTGQLDLLDRDVRSDLQRLLDAEPLRRESLQRVLAASRAYARELALPAGQYVARTLEDDLLNEVTDGQHPWPRVIVGEAGAGKSTMLWSLDQELRRAGFDPVIVSAAWTLSQPQRMDDLVRAITLMAEVGTPLLLLDTVDLLLHQEEQRQALLALAEQVWSVGAGAVYSTRPQEKPLLQHPELRVTELGAYDDVELRQATAALTSLYCPAGPRAAIVGRVEYAIARGLPAADVCRSPLLLRMLFEAASPDAPEFDDLDVTTLYGGYWDRRVVRDARSEGAVAMRLSHHDDLSTTAQTVAAALLILGLPQEQTGIVLTVADCLEARTDRAALTEDIGRLEERGVLEPGGATVGFFHQTMFEYAFARWWDASRDAAVLEQLVQRTTAGQGDLFVGAALEQTLILAAREGNGAERVRDACRRLVATGNGSIQAIGLAAWAHGPGVLGPARTALRECDEAAVTRTARLLPSIGGKPVGEVVSQLILLWEAKDSHVTRVAVLRALARVALRDPKVVVEALEHLYPAGGVPPVSAAAPTVSSSDVVNAARAIADQDPDPLTLSFMEVFDHLPVEHATAIRRLYVSILRRGDTARRLILEHLVTHWRDLGSADFLYEVMRSVHGPQLRTSLLEPCGRLLAAEWVREAESQRRRVDVRSLLVEPSGVYGPNVEVFARGALAAQVDDEGMELLVSSLLNERDVYLAEARISLSALVRDHEPAARRVAELVVGVLGRLRQGGLSPSDRNVMAFVAENQLPDSLFRRSLGTVGQDEWAMYPELTQLWARAASAGVPTAQSALEEMAASPQRRESAVTAALLSAPSMTFGNSDSVFEQVLSIALAVEDMTAVDRLLAGATLTRSRQDLVDTLLEKSVGGLHMPLLLRRGELYPWEGVRKALATEDDQIRAAVLGSLWKRREDDATDDERIAYLRTLVRVDPQADAPVDRATPTVSLGILTESARSLHYIHCLRSTVQEEDWSTIRTLALYPPLLPTPVVLGQAFAVTLGWLEKLGKQGNPRMPALLLEFLSGVRSAEFVPLTLGLWKRELINSVNLAVGIGGAEIAVQLCQEASRSHAAIAPTLVTTLADRWYSSVREELIQIGQTTTDSELRELCQHVVREKDRSSGTRAFPDLIPVLATRLATVVG